jgi:hypothetical protein
LKNSLLDLYADRAAPCRLELELSSQTEGTAIPQLFVRAGDTEQEIVVHSQTPEHYSIDLNLHPGQNLIQLSTLRHLNESRNYRLHLHSIRISPAS